MEKYFPPQVEQVRHWVYDVEPGFIQSLAEFANITNQERRTGIMLGYDTETTAHTPKFRLFSASNQIFTGFGLCIIGSNIIHQGLIKEFGQSITPKIVYSKKTNRVVYGVNTYKNQKEEHRWNRVNIEGREYSLDSTFGQQNRIRNHILFFPGYLEPALYDYKTPPEDITKLYEDWPREEVAFLSGIGNPTIREQSLEAFGKLLQSVRA